MPEWYKNQTFTPLMSLCNYGPIDIALLQCGADPSIKNNKGLTALDHFVRSFMNLKKDVGFGHSLCFFAFQSLSALLNAVDKQHRTEFFKRYLPVSDLPNNDKLSYMTFYLQNQSDSYSKNNTEFKSCNFAASFLYMLPRIPSLEAKKMLQFYMDSLSTTEDRKVFKVKMQGLLDFTNSQDVSHAYVEYDQISEMHQKNHWTAIAETVNNLA